MEQAVVWVLKSLFRLPEIHSLIDDMSDVGEIHVDRHPACGRTNSTARQNQRGYGEQERKVHRQWQRINIDHMS